MKYCTFHPHSSIESAKACYEKRKGKRADRLLSNMTPHKPLMTNYGKQPKVVNRSGIVIYIFSEDAYTPYC